ncbi:hypothetical protein SLI_6200 [Streptomyces lividans 1326]|uniref:Uncharacterized protein n=1 Tax=Streptomyces lividans 1326 TaxID=1200984 RepID=A0A7U9DVH2_STRLI|nr:hypothetical protein SLI_6200 [Streptomyces lividans 1326]
MLRGGGAAHARAAAGSAARHTGGLPARHAGRPTAGGTTTAAAHPDLDASPLTVHELVASY